jgi:hypothetical protein
VAPTGLAFRAASLRSAAQRLLPVLRRLALVAGRVIEVIRLDRPIQLALHLVGQGRIAQPPAPLIAGPDMDSQFPSNAPGRTGEAHQKGGEYPVRQWPCALVQQGLGKVVEGALATRAPVAFTPGSVVVLAPGIDLVTVAPGTLEGAILPPQGVDVRLTLLGAEKLVDVGEHRHVEDSPES